MGGRVYADSKQVLWRGGKVRRQTQLCRVRRATYVRRVPITIPVSVGELVDRITILRLKKARFHEREKIAAVSSELDRLEEIREREVDELDAIEAFVLDLAEINGRLWNIENELRELEEDQDFGPRFVESARRVYLLNDERYRLKCAIGEACGSDLTEEKSYTTG